MQGERNATRKNVASATRGVTARLLFLSAHLHVSFCTPFIRRNVSQSRCYQHQSGLAIWKATCHSCPPSYLPIDPLKRIVRPQAAPMVGREAVVGERLFITPFYYCRSFLEFHLLQFGRYFLRFFLAASLSS